MVVTALSDAFDEITYLVRSCRGKISKGRRCKCRMLVVLPSDKAHTSRGQDGNGNSLSALHPFGNNDRSVFRIARDISLFP